jgi:hypothetical protein
MKSQIQRLAAAVPFTTKVAFSTTLIALLGLILSDLSSWGDPGETAAYPSRTAISDEAYTRMLEKAVTELLEERKFFVQGLSCPKTVGVGTADLVIDLSKEKSGRAITLDI